MTSEIFDDRVDAAIMTSRDDGQDIPAWTHLPNHQRAIYFTITGLSFAITTYLFCKSSTSNFIDSPTGSHEWQEIQNRTQEADGLDFIDRRCRRLTFKTLRHMTYVRFLVLMSYLLSMAFSMSAIALVAHGISSLSICRSAIYVCIFFLFTGKMTMQLFLIERMHVANINYLRRRDDPVWWASMATVAVAGTALFVWTYVNPVYYMSSTDGRCRKGLPPNVVGPIQAAELSLNLVLTLVFLQMLNRSRRTELFAGEPQRIDEMTESLKATARKLKHLPARFGPKPKGVVIMDESMNSTVSDVSPEDSTIIKPKMSREGKSSELQPIPVILPASTKPSRLRNLARKSLIGTILMMLWSISNSVVFYVTRGHENAWLCFIQCTIDGMLSPSIFFQNATNKTRSHPFRHCPPLAHQ